LIKELQNFPTFNTQVTFSPFTLCIWQISRIISEAISEYSPSEQPAIKKPRIAPEDQNGFEDNEFKVLVPYQDFSPPEQLPKIPAMGPVRSLHQIYWSIQQSKLNQQLEGKKYWEQ